ncbi:MAG: zinc-ribbon domain-containing protein [Candidatus Lokiarchaeota archaeon]|nr:zinc-ribbon domain-containing protein [Candidatus Lokiarchaeota archaeon]
MKETKDYIWILPFIGSIVAAIGLFTPAAALPAGGLTELFWMHGFYLVVGGGYPDPGFITHIPGLMVIGISCMVVLVVCTIILFISSLTHRGVDAPGSWLALSILLIGGTIFFIGGAEVAFRIYGFINFDIVDLSFWQHRNPGFAVIAPFIAGGLTLLGYIISKATREGEVKITPISTNATPDNNEIPTTEEETPPAVSTSSEAFSFCPECGQKIPSSDDKFCLSCGFELKKD